MESYKRQGKGERIYWGLTDREIGYALKESQVCSISLARNVRVLRTTWGWFTNTNGDSPKRGAAQGEKFLNLSQTSLRGIVYFD